MNSFMNKIACMLMLCCFVFANGGALKGEKYGTDKPISIKELINVNTNTGNEIEKVKVIKEVNPLVAKKAAYDNLHIEHAANFNGPTLWNEIEVSPQNGSRDGNVSVNVCSSDSWSGEIYYILLDTQNWWAWGSDGWIQHSAGGYACEDFAVSVPAGNYMFILGDSYGDGGGSADVSMNGDLVGTVATASGDAYSDISGLYEAPFVFDVTDAPVTDATVTFNIDGVEECGFVSVTGTFDGWSGWGATTDTGMAASIPAGDHEFVILCVNTEGEWWNDIWANSTQYSAPIDGDCWNGNYDYANYTLSVGDDDMAVAYCAGTCDAECPSSCEGTDVTLTVGGGSYDGEISWDLSDGSSGGAGTFELCLADGDYTFNGYDSWGDGWNGGSATFTDSDGNVLASYVVAGSSDSWTLTIGGAPPVGGCTDPNAPNYDPNAEVDDGSCEFYCSDGYSMCASGDQCIYASYVCDGSSELGNGSWGPDCADGSDEGESCCGIGDNNYPEEFCAADCEGVVFGDAIEDCAGVCNGTAVLDDCGVCDGDGSSCDCDDFVLTMVDSYGDGWNGNEFCIGAACSTIETGSTGTANYCVDMSVANDVTCGGGSYMGEVSWSLADASGTEVLAGGAPYAGCLGDCGVGGCMDPNSSNYNADATFDDGTCEAYVGMDCAYFGNDGSVVDCDLIYCVPVSWIGDGGCDGYFECDAFACDGGDCDSDCNGDCGGDAIPSVECWDYSMVCDEAECPEEPVCEENNITLTVGGGSYDSEITWDLSDGSSGVAGTFALCLADGDYIFNGYDSWGDGWNGASANFYDEDGALFASFAVDGAEGSWTLTVGAPPVEIPAAPGDLAVEGAYEIEYGPVLNMTWSPVEGADYYGVYIWDDTPAEICDDGIDNNGNGAIDCMDGECYGAEACPCLGVFGWIGDGYCDDVNNGEDCDYDGGDCCPGDCVSDTYDCETNGGTCDDCIDPNSADLAEGGQCVDGGGYACAEGELLVSMVDAWGDGWNGNVLTIGDASFTIELGASAEGCYAGGSDVAVTCGGGSYMSEVSWSISNEAGDELLAGGAPYDGCLGTCEDDGGDECDGNEIALEVGGGSYDSEISWDLSDGSSGDAGSFGLCLADGDYTFNGYDSWGDGWNGGSATFSYASDGTVIATFELLEGSSVSGIVTIGAGGDVIADGPEESKGFRMGTLEHKLALEYSKGVSTSASVGQDHHMNQGNGIDREGWINLGYFYHYAPDFEDFTITNFTYGQTELLGVSSVNIAGESEIASASGTTPDMTAPYNLNASDDNGDGTVALTWEYDGFSPVPYPECNGVVTWIADGYCDLSNNNPDCDYDGGDCCESTCVDDVYTCGENNQSDDDGDGIWDNCCDPEAGGDCVEPEPCTSLNPVVMAGGDENGCLNYTNAFTFTFEENCAVSTISYGSDPAEMSDLSGYMFYGTFDFFGFGPDETYYFQLSTADGVSSGIFEGTTSGYDCAGDAPYPDCTGYLNYIGDGYCDASNNNEGCGYDGGDCCPGECEALVAEGCPDNPDGCYSLISCGDCADCGDPNSPDLAEGGACYDDGSGPEAIFTFAAEGSGGSIDFTISGCAAQTLVVGGGSWDSEITWDISDGSSGAAGTHALALADGDYTFNGYDSYGDGWNGGSATMTCADGGDVIANGYRAYKFEPNTLHNGSGLTVTDGSASKPIIIEENVDRLVSSFNVYDADGAAIGSAFDLLFNVASDGGCWTVTAYDADLDVESGASNEACFDGCATAGTGDANGDGDLNVLDVVVIVGEVLEPSWDAGSCELATADANGDGELNVLDVVIIVGNILDGRTVDADSATIYKADSGVTIDANGFVAGVEMKISHGENFALNLTDNAMVADYVTKGNTTHLIVVAPESEVIFTSTGDFTIDEVIAANTNGEYISLDNGIPSEFSLSSAYPNPFNPVTNMKLSLVNASNVSMNVYNVSGQLVDVLVDGALDAGYHNIAWDASSVSSGVYFVKVISGSNVSVQKLMLLK